MSSAMKKTLIAETNSIPETLRNTVSFAKMMLLVSAGIALIGIVIALSTDTTNHKEQYFVDIEGYAQQGFRLRGVKGRDVKRAYPYTVTGEEFDALNSHQDSVTRDSTLPFNE